MKTKLLISLTISIIVLGCTQQQNEPMEGAWQVVSWEQGSADSMVSMFPGIVSGSEMKIWSKNHFAFAGQYKNDSTITDNCGGGTYQLNGIHYEETIMYFPDKSVIGTTIKLLLEIRNDTLIQTWPVDENWEIIKSNYNIQKLNRLE